ncbi:MAG: ACT domain-containing protein [Clostridia bacterium]|nr:ACT domain-containing protein [Clostridia bacterium]
MEDRSEKYLLVRDTILPEAVRKTAQAKELLNRGEVSTVNDAVSRVGISRSAYYKYKDGVFSFNAMNREKLVSIALVLDHRAGILSRILNTLAESGANILTINQSIPLQGTANVSISMETTDLKRDLEELLFALRDTKGARKVEVVGHS